MIIDRNSAKLDSDSFLFIYNKIHPSDKFPISSTVHSKYTCCVPLRPPFSPQICPRCPSICLRICLLFIYTKKGPVFTSGLKNQQLTLRKGRALTLPYTSSVYFKIISNVLIAIQTLVLILSPII